MKAVLDEQRIPSGRQHDWKLRVRRDVVEDRCLSRLKQELSTPDHVALFLKETTRLLTERAQSAQSEVGRLQTLVQNLSNISPRYRDSLREQIHALVGEIKLAQTADGYLEAGLPPPFEGLLKLVSGSENTVGCGGGI